MTSGAVSSVGERNSPRETCSATWIVAKGGNDTWFRCDAPAEVVGGKVLYVREPDEQRAYSYPNNNTGLKWTIALDTPDGVVRSSTKTDYLRTARRHIRAGVRYSDVRYEFPEVDGTAIWVRPCGRRAVLANEMREQGAMTIAETDDNYLSAGHWNLYQRKNNWGEAGIDIITKAMASFDRNIYSTAWLRDRYLREFKKRLGKQNLPEMFVCRNHIPRYSWPERDEGEGRLRVGFMGSGSHVWDINMAYTGLHAAKTYADAEIVMIGYNPAHPDAQPDKLTIGDMDLFDRSEKSRLYRDKWANVVDVAIPWIDPGEYRRASLPLDIGVAPIARADDFTLGKSDAKALEYTISGAACVLSGQGIYDAGGWKHEQNCLIAGSQQEMAHAVLRLCRDEKLRYELVSAAQEMIWNERNEDVMRQEWSEALSL